MIRVAALDKRSRHLNAIIDTPKGSRNKFKYDEQLGLFKLSGMLPVGNVFPFHFGYIPSTRGDDGDALDILLLMDEPAFTGYLGAGEIDRGNRSRADGRAKDHAQ